MTTQAPIPRPPEELICILTKNHNKAGLVGFLIGQPTHQRLLITSLSLDGQEAKLPIEYAFDTLSDPKSADIFESLKYVAFDAIEYFMMKTLDSLETFSQEPLQFELVSSALSRLSEIKHPWFEPYYNDLLALKVKHEQQRAMTFAYDGTDVKADASMASSNTSVALDGASSSTGSQSPNSSPRAQF